MNDNLRPCPFCGAESIINIIEPHTHNMAKFMPDYAGGAFVECTACGSGVSGSTEAEAAAAWNIRQEETRLDRRLETVMEENRMLAQRLEHITARAAEAEQERRSLYEQIGRMESERMMKNGRD